MMPFELFMAFRYLRESRTQTALILSGIAVGVGVIVFLSALIDGLQVSLIEKTLGSQTHIIVKPDESSLESLSADGETAVAAKVEKTIKRLETISDWQRYQRLIDRVAHVQATAPTVAGSAFVSRGNTNMSVALRGIEPDTFRRIIPIDEKMHAGEFRIAGGEVVIGVELAKDLGVRVGDKLRIITEENVSDRFTISGIFDLGVKDINRRWVFVRLKAAQSLLDMAGAVSTIEVRIDEIFEAENTAGRIQEMTGLDADSWMKLNEQLLIGLRSQNSSRYMIQFFVIVAVALGIASVLAVSVSQKSREIGILKATGTTTNRIMRIFLLQGGLLGVAGSILGCLLGAGLSLLFQNLAKNPDGSPTFPVALTFTLYLSAALTALLTGLVGSIVPARRAAKLDPIVVIRYG